MLTRRGLDWTDKYSLIAKDAAAIEATSFIIDGEICVQDETGRTDFGAVREAMTREPHRRRPAHRHRVSRRMISSRLMPPAASARAG